MPTRWKTGLVATGFTTAAGLGGGGGLRSAHAGPWLPQGNGGIYLGLRFGGDGPVRFVFGIEGTAAYVDHANSCDGAMQTYSGAVARLEITEWDKRRLTIGPVLGTTNGLVGYAVDAGVGVGLGRERGPVALLGAEVSGLLLFDARLAYSLRRDWQATVGARLPPFSFAANCATGRPLRRDGARAPVAGATRISGSQARAPILGAPAGPSTATGASSDHADDRLRAAGVWLDRARLEWASVPAFLELADQLRVCGAPSDLVARARGAAADELRHAVASGELAATLGDLALLSLDPPSTTPSRPAATETTGLVRLAVESLVDGCVAEGAAADQAAREATLAATPAIARTQATIAVDEARHADLAWAILDWALAADRASVAPALRAALPNAFPTPTRRDESNRQVSLRSFGILDVASATVLREERHARTHARVCASLGGEARRSG
ncbi:MAG: hypothetical protein ABUS79_30095 [Pseudomonadota bacterium]